MKWDADGMKSTFEGRAFTPGEGTGIMLFFLRIAGKTAKV